MKQPWLKLCLVLLVVLVFSFQTGLAAPAPAHTLVPIGSDYNQNTLQLFAHAAVLRDTSHTVDLLVIPITYGTDAYRTTNGERQKNLTLADNRRSQIETACNAVKLPDQICRVVLAPVLIRWDAYLQSNLDLFVPDLDGMYILGGDQTIAMQVVANTPFEDRMASAFNLGAVVSGNSAGVDQDTWAAFPASGELGLPEGRHTVDVRAADRAGLTTSSSKTYWLDGTLPTVEVQPRRYSWEWQLVCHGSVSFCLSQ